jgi:hypothetical protein
MSDDNQLLDLNEVVSDGEHEEKGGEQEEKDDEQGEGKGDEQGEGKGDEQGEEAFSSPISQLPSPYISIEQVEMPPPPFVGSLKLPCGWLLISKKRKRGITKGRVDRYWLSPSGKRFNFMCKVRQELQRGEEERVQRQG